MNGCSSQQFQFSGFFSVILGDDGPNALVVAVPVLAVLLLVAACIIGFLLYRR